MRTLTFESDNSKNLDLLKEYALKLGISIKEESREEKFERLRKLAKKLDESVKPNDITMEEIVEEVRLVREERARYGKSLD